MVPRELKIPLPCQRDTQGTTVSALEIKITKPSGKMTVERSEVMKLSNKGKKSLPRGPTTKISRLKHLMHSIRLSLKRRLKLSKTQNSSQSKRPNKARKTCFWHKNWKSLSRLRTFPRPKPRLSTSLNRQKMWQLSKITENSSWKL